MMIVLLRKILLLIVTIATGFFLLILISILNFKTGSYVSYVKGYDLSLDNKTVRTEYKIRLSNEREVIVIDQYNHIFRSLGARPKLIEIENNVRKVLFIAPVMLKTKVDSIDIQKEKVKYKGWMGTITKGKRFFVEQSGQISANHAAENFNSATDI